MNWFFTALNSRRLRAVSIADSLKTPTSSSKATPILNGPNKKRQRQNSDEYYVIGLCNEVLGQTALQQHRFEFLRGDTGRKLPVDAYYEQLNLVVEYCETQHTEAAPFFDRSTSKRPTYWLPRPTYGSMRAASGRSPSSAPGCRNSPAFPASAGARSTTATSGRMPPEATTTGSRAWCAPMSYCTT